MPHTINTRNSEEQVNDRIIHISTFLPVKPERAFLYFTNNDLLESWLTAKAAVDPRPGGKYEIFWQPTDPANNSTIGCRISAISPAQFISFQWRSPKQFKAFANTADPLTHVVVMFTPEGTGTRVHLIHSGWHSDSKWEEARVWQESAWSGAFKQLEAIAKP